MAIKKNVEKILSDIDYDLGKTAIKNATYDQTDFLGCFDSQLIAWITELAVEEISEEFIDTIFQNLLCSIQKIENSEYFQNFKLEIKNRARNIIQKEISQEKRQLFYQTGLSYQSNEILYEFVESLVANIQDYKETDNLPLNIWEEIFENFSKLSEFRQISKNDINMFFILACW